MKNLVIVESPAKAKTINKYLGPNFTVLASYGHVRDLPPKDGSVDTDNDFEMKWEVATDSKKHLKAISDALKEDNNLILTNEEFELFSKIDLNIKNFDCIIISDYNKGLLTNSLINKIITIAKKNNIKIAMSLSDIFCVTRHKQDFYNLQ